MVLGQDHNLRGAHPQGQGVLLPCLATCNLPPGLRACTEVRGRGLPGSLMTGEGALDMDTSGSPAVQPQNSAVIHTSATCSFKFAYSACVCLPASSSLHDPPPYTRPSFPTPSLSEHLCTHTHTTYQIHVHSCSYTYEYTYTHNTHTCLHTGPYAPYTCTDVSACGHSAYPTCTKMYVCSYNAHRHHKHTPPYTLAHVYTCVCT